MAMAGLYMMVRAFDAEGERPWKELLTAQVCFAALAITHHVTSWLLLGCLWAMVCFFSLDEQPRRRRLTLSPPRRAGPPGRRPWAPAGA